MRAGINEYIACVRFESALELIRAREFVVVR
jgi:hypothetical protein